MPSTHTIHRNPTCSRVISITLISSVYLPPAIFFNFIASNWPDVQSPMLAAGHLAGRCAASPIAAEVHSDVNGAYCAHATTKFQACEYAPRLDAINLQYLDLPTAFCFHPGCYSLGNRRGQQFGPCLSLTN